MVRWFLYEREDPISGIYIKKRIDQVVIVRNVIKKYQNVARITQQQQLIHEDCWKAL